MHSCPSRETACRMLTELTDTDRTVISFIRALSSSKVFVHFWPDFQPKTIPI